ncbi:MAG: ribosome maturation factor RimM [Cyclobacteriaceae bacterium]
MKQDDCYLLGNVTKAHGLRGEIQLYLDVDTPDSYQELESIFILMNNKLVPFFIETLQINNNKALVKLEGVETREESEALAGKEVYLPLSFLPTLDDHQFYYHEIVGYDFSDKDEVIGKVESVITLSAQTLLTVRVGKDEVLVPLQDDIITEVDKSNQQIKAILPDGLLDIYLSEEDADNED